MITDFNKVADMPIEVVEKYRDQVPTELLQIWQEDGLGSFLNGYLKVINPDDYIELIQTTYFRGDVSVPIFVTVFGDVITWEKNRYVGLIKYKDGVFDIICSGLDIFIKFIDNSYITDNFELPLYQQAIEKYGQLNYNQCFGFVPLLALGGPKDVEHLDKVKILEHLLLITHFVGGVGVNK